MNAVDSFFQKYAFPEPDPEARPYGFGFFRRGNERILQKFLAGKELIVEIGCLLGASTRFLLETHPQARVICVDHWQQVFPLALPMFETGDQIFQSFLANLALSRERLAVLRMCSPMALRLIKEAGLKPDGIYVDGDHVYDAVKCDLNLSQQFFPGIQLTGDDFHEEFGHVVRACREFALQHHKQILVDESAWAMVDCEEAQR